MPFEFCTGLPQLDAAPLDVSLTDIAGVDDEGPIIQLRLYGAPLHTVPVI